MSQSYHAIVLAGGDDVLAKRYRVAHKALIPIGNDAYLVSNLLKQLILAPQIASIGYVGLLPDGLAAATTQKLSWNITGHSTFTASVAAGLEESYTYYPDGDPFLLLTSADIPYVCGNEIEALLETAHHWQLEDKTIDLCFVAVDVASCRQAFPNHKRTTIHLLEAEVTAANLVVVRRSCLAALLPWLSQAYQKRKNPLALAQLLGWSVLWKVFWRRASLPWLENYASELLNMNVRVLLSQEASLATDIDSLAHLQAYLSSRDGDVE